MTNVQITTETVYISTSAEESIKIPFNDFIELMEIAKVLSQMKDHSQLKEFSFSV